MAQTGKGKIECAIKAAFKAEPERTFTVPDLFRKAYPEVPLCEKKHRVVLLRAAKKVIARDPRWEMVRQLRVSGEPAIFRNKVAAEKAKGQNVVTSAA